MLSSVAMSQVRERDSSVTDSTLLALALVVVFGVIYAMLARYALLAYPFSGDEYSLTLQGELFARGLMKAPAPEHVEWLRIDHVVIDQFVRSKYPPGAPALLALGVRQGVPWLVTPLEAVATLLLVWHTIRRLLGPRPALIGLVTLGLAPLFMFDAASFYAHMPTMLFLAIAFACVASWSVSRRDLWLVPVGIAIGCAFLIRPVDALLFGLAMLAFRSPRAVIVPAATALPFVIVNLWYQQQLFGGWFTDGYHAYGPTFTALYGAQTAGTPLSIWNFFSATQQWNHVDIYRSLVVEWTIPGAVIVAMFGAFAVDRRDPARPMRTFSIALIAVYAFGLLVMIADPDDGPHPRYLSVTLIPLAFLAAAGYAKTTEALAVRFGKRIRTVVVVAAIVFALAQLGSFLQDRIPKIWRRQGLYTAVAEHHVQPGTVVVIRAQFPSRFARNGPFFDGVLYLSAPADTTVDTIGAAYPGHEIWEAHEGLPWTVVRIR